jgi:PhoH-like ATPase
MKSSRSTKRKRTTKSTGRKTFVIDTSVLLYDKEAIKSFPGNDMIIPMIVLDELDRNKERPGIVGENARSVNRFLDSLRKIGKLHDGVTLENGQTIRVESWDGASPGGLEQTSDNKILGLAMNAKTRFSDVIVVTKDINLRVKCDALNLQAEDYYKDNIKDIPRSGVAREILVDDAVVDCLHSRKRMLSTTVYESVNEKSECLILKSNVNPSKSVLALAVGDDIKLVTSQLNGTVQTKTKNKEQAFALSMMTDDAIQLVMLTGIAGSGKTFLALSVAMSALLDKKYKRIIITRPIQPVGKDIGFLPGDIDEKMNPWIRPITDNFRECFGDSNTNYFEMMKERGQIEIAPLSHIRGRTFNDSFIIVDEAQNASVHELKTVITRVGQKSKIVLLGDIEQVDTPHLDMLSNGLSITIDRFKDQVIAGHVTLPKSERSDLAAIASAIM